MTSRTVITGRVRGQGGRAACVSAKTATAVDAQGREAVVTLGVWSHGMNGRKREGTVEIPCGRRRLRHRKPTYKARAEVAGDAAWEVGGGHISEEGVDSKTRRSEGPLLEPGFRRRRDCVTAPKAQRTPFEKVRVLQRKLYRAAKAQPQRTFGVLYDKVCRLEVLG